MGIIAVIQFIINDFLVIINKNTFAVKANRISSPVGFLLLFLFQIPVFSQTYPGKNFTNAPSKDYIANVQRYDIQDGLSHRDVYCTYQDSRGFIWVGTRYGLNRFDGHHFETFSQEKQDLPFNEFKLIIEDAEGWLWLFKTIDPKVKEEKTKVLFINIYTKKVQTFEERFGTALSFSPNEINSALKAPNGSLYFGTNLGKILRFSPKDGFKEITIDKGELLEIDRITQNGNLIAKNIRSLDDAEYLSLDTLGNRLWSIQDAADYFYIGGDTDEKLWFNIFRENHPNYGLKLFPINGNNGDKGNVISLQTSTDFRYSSGRSDIFYSAHNDIYLFEGLANFFAFHPEKGVLFDFKKEYKEIIDSSIEQIGFDNRNNAWASTAYGLFKIHLKPNPFRTFLSHSEKNFNIVNTFSARGMMVKGDYLWATSEQQHEKYRVNLETGDLMQLNFIVKPNQNGDSEPFGIHVVNDLNESEIIFGAGNCQVIFNTIDNSYKILHNDPVLGLQRTWSLFTDSKGNYWSGVEQRGLIYWDVRTDSLLQYKKVNEFKELLNSTLYTFVELDAKHILIGGDFGIYVLHQDKGIIKRFWADGKTGHHLPNSYVYHIQRDKQEKDKFWVATAGGGVLQLEIDNEELIIENLLHFSTVDGLPSNVVYAVYEDHKENLWLPSDYGIICMNKDKDHLKVKTFLEVDGITHHEFNRTAHFQDKDGTIYFGGLNGITAFHPDDLEAYQVGKDAPLQITRFQQYDGALDDIIDRTDEIVLNQSIVLNPNDNFFLLELALLEFYDDANIRYSYEIEGLTQEIYLNDNVLRVTGLPYGKHILRIRGQGSSSQISVHELAIPISVLRPIYLQWWFVGLLLVLLAGSLSYFYKRRTTVFKERQAELELAVNEATQTIRQQNDELKDLNKVKSRFFANVSHELRTPISLILGPINSMLQSGNLDNKNAHFAELGRKNAKGLLGLVNEILDLSKMDAGKVGLNKEGILFYPMLLLLVDAFEWLAKKRNIDYQFSYSANKNLCLELDVKKTQKIINNLLSNAFKFTPDGGQIKLLVNENEGHLSISLSDSGRGIHSNDIPYIFDRYFQSSQADAPKEGGTGIGLSLCMEYAKLMDGKLWAESELKKGSTFHFEFPKVITETEVRMDAFEAIIDNNQESFLNEKTIAEKRNNLGKDVPVILLVEDNGNLRDYIRLILETKYQVIMAENGKKAWDLLTVDGCRLTVDDHAQTDNRQPPTDNRLPSLIISDIMMPEMDGFQLLEKLKGNDNFRGIPVIMLTAVAELKAKLKALRIGVDDYMTKPFNENELIARIENLLQHREWRQQYHVEIKKEEETTIEHTENVRDTEPKENAVPMEEVETILAELTEEDSIWLEELETAIKDKLGDFDFSIEQLSQDLASNRWSVYRRLKQVTGLTPTQYLKEIRLNHARHLLEQNIPHSVKALSYDIGMKDVKYFSRQFKSRFGKLPSAYF